jgi:uncharacterized protein YqhQ
MSNDRKCCAKKTSIGGQALMEGIMMRGPQTSAMAVRNTKGEIVLEKFPTEVKERKKFWKLPLVRGIYNYIDSMKMGSKCLMRSAEISGLEEAEEELKREKAAKKAEKLAKKKGISVEELAAQEQKTEESTEKKKEDNSFFTGLILVLGTVLGFVLAIGLFMVLPSFIYSGIVKLFPGMESENPAVKSLVKSVFEGVVKIILLVGYMALISLMKDIRRTFMYHGAEHKTIFCYEQGLELTVENVRMQKRFHPRCGTSFLILMLLVSIFVSFFIDPLYTLILGESTVAELGTTVMTIIRAGTKILLIPLIVGIGYELIKLAGKYDNLFTRIISAPGVWLQHLTVFEPDDDMIECAIMAMKEAIPSDVSDNW